MECSRVEFIRRTHNAVEMAHEYAKSHAKEEIALPEEFKRHAALFSDEEAKKFPPLRPHDHKIELTDKAPAAFNMKMYPMSNKDQITEDKFLDENLEKGYIVPSDSPYGFSTFQVPKKDSDEMRYIIDYCPLNAVTKCDVTPLPNLAQCIEDLQGMELFSKFDIRWGYNNIRIREEDQWKAAFKTRQGLFEPSHVFQNEQQPRRLPMLYEPHSRTLVQETWPQARQKLHGRHRNWNPPQRYSKTYRNDPRPLHHLGSTWATSKAQQISLHATSNGFPRC
jgi:hypothetical protein